MITLEEISGYFPHKLKAVLTVDLTEEYSECDWADLEKFEKGKIWELTGYADKDLNIPLGEGEIEGFIFRNDFTYTSFHDGYKFLLRPLSDLTKEIEINGEKFVPIIELAKYLWPERDNWEYVEFDKIEQAYYIKSKVGESYLHYAIEIDENILYKIAQKLLSWHFWLCDQDRFGKDIIDINTLK